MHAAFFVETPEGLAITLGEQPRPEPREGEVLVKVYAAGITPTEREWYPTTHTVDGSKRVDAIPAHEFAGVVAAVGRAVTGVRVGAKIFGMNDWFAQGATAEYCVAQPGQLALKPKTLTYAEAAAVPIAALTAWQGLFTKAKLEAGETVLVHGGAGAVGAFVIKLAKMHGADVVATCGAKDMEFVRSLGADEVFDYRATATETLPHGMDVLFDTVGGETWEKSQALLKKTGREVTIASSAEGTGDARTKDAFFLVEPDREQLETVATLIDGGFLQSLVGAVVPLRETGTAFANEVQRKDGRGKVVVGLGPEAASS